MPTNKKLAIFSWSLYGFANTIFSMNVISLYFALWVVIDKKGEDIFYSIALSISMLLAALSAPIMGAISDKTGKRMIFLIIPTIICCVLTMCIGTVNQLMMGLLFFTAANYFFQIADIFYNSLLHQVSGGINVGRISGYGIGLGYLGTIVGLLLVSPFALKYGRQATFIPTAMLFILFALPCFLFVKDQITDEQKENKLKLGTLINEAFLTIKNTITHIRQFRALFNFFLAIFIALNAINTIFIFMSIFTKQVAGFHDSEIITFYVVSSVFAVAGGLFSGFITDKLGAKKTLMSALFLWCFSLTAAIITNNKLVFWIIGPMVGIGLGSTWTSARAMVVDLSPPHMMGEMFGFYGLVNKTAAIIGPLTWGAVIWGFHFLGMVKYRVGVAVMLLFLIVGLIILRKVPCTKSTTHCQKS